MAGSLRVGWHHRRETRVGQVAGGLDETAVAPVHVDLPQPGIGHHNAMDWQRVQELVTDDTAENGPCSTADGSRPSTSIGS